MRTLSLSLLAISACANAQVVFQTTYDGPLGAYDAGHGVTQTSDGGFAVVGITSGNNVFDGSLVRFNADGDILWSHQYDLGYFEVLEDVFQMPDGGFMLGGYAGYAGDYNGPLLIRTDANGDTLWTRLSTGEGGHNQGSGMCRTAQDGAAITGEVLIAEGEPLLAALRVFDADGNPQASLVFGTGGEKKGRDIIQLEDGGFLITGSSRFPSSDSTQLMLIRTDATGWPVWYKYYGGDGNDVGNAACQRQAGGFYVVGSTTDPITGDQDAWLLVSDEAGDTLSSLHIDNDSDAPGGTHRDHGIDVMECDSGAFIVLYNTNYDSGDKTRLLYTDEDGLPIYTFDLGEDGEYVFGNGFAPVSNGDVVIAAYYNHQGTAPDMLIAEVAGSCISTGLPSDGVDIDPAPHAAPNPFVGTVIIELSTPLPDARFELIDHLGRQVRVIDNFGQRLISWDGKDASGASVPDGAYVFRIIDERAMRALTIVKASD